MPRRQTRRTSSPKSAVPFLSIALSIIAIAVSGYALYTVQHLPPATTIVQQSQSASGTSQGSQGSSLALPDYNIQSALITPQSSLAAYPVITDNKSLGSTLNGINAPLNQTELSAINNEPDSYYEKAGEYLLNNSLASFFGGAGSPGVKVNAFTVNGKPSVIYLGSITCVFCGENRWAMALALAKFGSFNSLYKGYSALHDQDVPTLYWLPATYNSSQVNLGSFYNSSLVNLIVIEDTMPISGGFNLEPLNSMQNQINATGNLAYKDAFEYILKMGNFQGTPYTIWGTYQYSGANGEIFGNLNATIGSSLPLTYMTHDQVLNQIRSFNTSFSWGEYAAADLYIAQLCPSLNNTPSVCNLPAIKGIQQRLSIS
ncbi:MAG: DUF929 family protein [Candidatus Micrarchaeota archaeon]|nr:DUF929 family protein [Candidatus Micrarchaeota archaeon]